MFVYWEMAKTWHSPCPLWILRTSTQLNDKIIGRCCRKQRYEYNFHVRVSNILFRWLLYNLTNFETVTISANVSTFQLLQLMYQNIALTLHLFLLHVIISNHNFFLKTIPNFYWNFCFNRISIKYFDKNAVSIQRTKGKERWKRFSCAYIRE